MVERAPARSSLVAWRRGAALRLDHETGRLPAPSRRNSRASSRRASQRHLPSARQHYLLSTPFRYPSPHPSRFRPGGALGVWYGAERVETACTELAYWRWRFLMDSDGLRNTELIAEFSLFRAKVNGSAVDLSIHPWDARRSDWTSDDYSACLALAAEARRREVQWIRYWSARDVAGHCGAVLDPGSLKAIELNRQQTWVCKVSATAALMRHEQDSISLTFASR